MNRKPPWRLGFGFRCGFLGLLHMEIIQERLEREYELTLITTAPTVIYRILTTKGEVLEVNNPADLPEPSSIASFEEPFILATLISPGALCRHPLAVVPGAARHPTQHSLFGSHARHDQL